MITVERRRRIVSDVYVFTAGFVSAGQTIARTRWIFSRNVIVRLDVMMVEIDRQLEIIGHPVLELLTKIDDAIATMLLLPAGGNPLLEFAMPLRSKVCGISPRKDRFVRACGENTKQNRGRKS